MGEEQGVVVGQEDREAAATIYAKFGGRNAVETVHENILNGFEDDYWVVQAFARHRQASTAALVERVEALELALEPLALLAADQDTPGVNMSDPLSKWFTVAQLVTARDLLSEGKSK